MCPLKLEKSSLPLPDTKYALQTCYGTFVGANSHGRTYTINSCGDWETWTFAYNDKGGASLKSFHGQWLGADKDKVKTYTIGWCKVWETFTVKVSGSPLSLTFHTSHGTYLEASPISGLQQTKLTTSPERILSVVNHGSQVQPTTLKLPDFPFIHGAFISLRSRHCTYVSVNKHAKKGALLKNQSLTCETLKVERHGTHVAFKSHHNTYIGVGADGKVYISTQLTDNEKFQVHCNNTRWTIKSTYNSFLAFENPPSQILTTKGSELDNDAQWFVESLVTQ